MRRVLSHPLTGHLCRLLLGGAFVYANTTKLFRADEVARLVYGYRILHPDLVNLASVVFPWIEFIPGVLLVIGIIPRSAAALLGGLLAVFIGAAGLVMARGIDIECGCFLPIFGDRVGWPMIARNAILMLLALQTVAWPTSFLSGRRR